MARLDYALLAEFARVEPGGLLTVVGAGFSRVQLSQLPGQLQVYLAMRVFVEESEDSVPFEVNIKPPDEGFKLKMDGVAARTADAPTVDGEVGVAIAVGLALPIQTPGIYRVRISLQNNLEKKLQFSIDAPATA